jgi:hypothetical protein
MKHFIPAIALFAMLGSVAQAATPVAKSDATLLCRPATATEHANAQLTDPATGLLCKPFTIAMKTSDGTMHVIGTTVASNATQGPNLEKALTPQQVNDAWVRYLDTTFRIEHSS